MNDDQYQAQSQIPQNPQGMQGQQAPMQQDMQVPPAPATPPAPPIPDYQIENSFIQESAAEILKNERENPGSQDPDAVRWATEKVTAGIGSAPAPAAPDPMPITPSQTPQIADPATVEDNVLYINRDPVETTPPPQSDNNQPNSGGQGTTQ